jgi:hypothetical protein
MYPLHGGAEKRHEGIRVASIVAGSEEIIRICTIFRALGWK